MSRKHLRRVRPTTELHTLWHTAGARCELAYSRIRGGRVLLWIGPWLVYEQMVTSYDEAITVAAELAEGNR
jgi:hypothetical protein